MVLRAFWTLSLRRPLVTAVVWLGMVPRRRRWTRYMVIGSIILVLAEGLTGLITLVMIKGPRDAAFGVASSMMLRCDLRIPLAIRHHHVVRPKGAGPLILVPLIVSVVILSMAS